MAAREPMTFVLKGTIAGCLLFEKENEAVLMKN